MVKKKPEPKRPSRPAASNKPTSNVSSIPTQATRISAITTEQRQQQQVILNVFRHTFNDVLSSPTFDVTLQAVKRALFEREFQKAFGEEAHLDAYAARWSPTRALCYTSVICDIQPHWEDLTLRLSNDADAPLKKLRLLAFGGGAAEIAAFGAALAQIGSVASQVVLVDSGPWDSVVQKLYHGLTEPPPLSKYASEAVKLANAPLITKEHLTVAFHQKDALQLHQEQLRAILGPEALVVTLLFTLNELFTSGGIGKTTAFLLALTATAPTGSLLLVVDSPGSYSETTVGAQSKKYPMAWLLDKILSSADDATWTKLESYDSVWFRLADNMSYPIPLEDMRYQMHLYKLHKPASTS